MATAKTYKNRYVKYRISPDNSSLFTPRPTENVNIILFSVSSEAFPHLSCSDISIIGGKGFTVGTRSFFELIPLSDEDMALFFRSLYTSYEGITLIPSGNKTLLLFTRFLRSSGLGLAFLLNLSPSNAAALVHSDLSDSLGDLRFSSSFDDLLADHGQIMELYQAVSYYSGKVVGTSFANDHSILDAIAAACEIFGLSADLQLSTEAEKITGFDYNAVFSLLLCIFSHASRSPNAKELNITVSGDRHTTVSVEFESDLSGDLSDMLFCERAAENMGTSFNLTAAERHITATFIPMREGPSPEGFKSGIFINGKRFVNPFL